MDNEQIVRILETIKRKVEKQSCFHEDMEERERLYENKCLDLQALDRAIEKFKTSIIKVDGMGMGKACAIFSQINSDKYSEAEKILAIRIVVDMETHNSITKDEILKVMDWLWHEKYNIIKE